MRVVAVDALPIDGNRFVLHARRDQFFAQRLVAHETLLGAVDANLILRRRRVRVVARGAVLLDRLVGESLFRQPRLHVDVAPLTEVRAEDADQLRLLAAVRVVAGEALARRDRSVHEFVVLLHHLMTHRAFLVVELVSVARLRHVTALAVGRLRMNDRMLHHVAVTLHTCASRGGRRRRATWSRSRRGAGGRRLLRLRPVRVHSCRDEHDHRDADQRSRRVLKTPGDYSQSPAPRRVQSASSRTLRRSSRSGHAVVITRRSPLPPRGHAVPAPRRQVRSFTWSPVPPSSRSGAAPTAPPSARRER